MIGKTIILLSSNASKEYILDALEVLALPFGAVQHFRYRLRWLDRELKEKLPIKKNSNKSKLNDFNVIICYLSQKRINEKWEWIAIYPLRAGVLVDAYKTGDNDMDVVHFYFKVYKYLNISNDIINKIENHLKERSIWGKAYSFITDDIMEIVSATENEGKAYSCFANICELLGKEHFKSPDGKIEYYPIFTLINGLKTEKKNLKIKYKHLYHKSYYEISEGSCYSLEFKTYFPNPPPEFSIILKNEEKLFSNQPEQKIKISSPYSEENFVLIPRFVEKDLYTSLTFKTNCEKFNDKEVLNLNISFLIKIKRNLWFRIIEITGEFGFGLGTGSIALAKILEGKWNWWYWPVIMGYFLWMICKLVLKLLWRG